MFDLLCLRFGDGWYVAFVVFCDLWLTVIDVCVSVVAYCVCACLLCLSV